eukprot:3593179-Pyramimonas_sp.AAC.1
MCRRVRLERASLFCSCCISSARDAEFLSARAGGFQPRTHRDASRWQACPDHSLEGLRRTPLEGRGRQAGRRTGDFIIHLSNRSGLGEEANNARRVGAMPRQTS